MSQDDKLQQIRDQLGKFGFTFYSFDESKRPLFQAQNGQIMDVRDAIDYANKIIEEQQNSSGGGPESMPQGPVVNVESGVESNVERNVEVQRQKPKEKQKKPQAPLNSNVTDVEERAPKVKAYSEDANVFGEGYKLSVNVDDDRAVNNFIAKSEEEPDTSANKWLAKKLAKLKLELENGFLD